MESEDIFGPQRTVNRLMEAFTETCHAPLKAFTMHWTLTTMETSFLFAFVVAHDSKDCLHSLSTTL